MFWIMHGKGLLTHVWGSQKISCLYSGCNIIHKGLMYSFAANWICGFAELLKCSGRVVGLREIRAWVNREGFADMVGILRTYRLSYERGLVESSFKVSQNVRHLKRTLKILWPKSFFCAFAMTPPDSLTWGKQTYEPAPIWWHPQKPVKSYSERSPWMLKEWPRMLRAGQSRLMRTTWLVMNRACKCYI